MHILLLFPSSASRSSSGQTQPSEDWAGRSPSQLRPARRAYLPSLRFLLRRPRAGSSDPGPAQQHIEGAFRACGALAVAMSAPRSCSGCRGRIGVVPFYFLSAALTAPQDRRATANNELCFFGVWPQLIYTVSGRAEREPPRRAARKRGFRIPGHTGRGRGAESQRPAARAQRLWRA